MKCINCPHGFHGVNHKCKVVVKEIYDYNPVLCGCVLQPSQAMRAVDVLSAALALPEEMVWKGHVKKRYTFSCDSTSHRYPETKPRRLAKWGRNIIEAQRLARADGWHIDRSGQVQCPDHFRPTRVMGQKVASK